MRRSLLLLALLALALPATASAKELTGFTMCGPDGCKTTDVSGMGHDAPFSSQGERPPAGPYFELTLLVDGSDGWRMFYVPSTGQVAFFDPDAQLVRWQRPIPKLAPLLKEAARDVTPYPGPRISFVTVGRRRVESRPASYLRLFAISGDYVDAGTGRAEQIRFHAAAPSPWTAETLTYYPDTDVLVGGGSWVHLPADLAANVEAARALDATPRGWARPVLLATAAAVGASLLLAAGILLLRRRTARPAPPVPASAP